MKLRNKKTGEIWDIGKVLVNDYPCWETLTQICKDWEDVKEPLIKNEKIRKAVMAWAEACNLKHVTYNQASNEFYDSDTRGAFAIRFTLIPVEVYLEDGEHYTIAELCGEEE